MIACREFVVISSRGNVVTIRSPFNRGHIFTRFQMSYRCLRFRLRTGVTYIMNYPLYRYHDRRGVEVGRTEIVVYACPMTGRKYVCGSHGNIALEKQWSPHPVPYALQATVKVLICFPSGHVICDII